MPETLITTEYITLGQFLKFVGVVENGGEEKTFLLRRDVRVNGEKEERRGRKLYPGYRVAIDGVSYAIKRDGS